MSCFFKKPPEARFRGLNLVQIVALAFGWSLMLRVLSELKAPRGRDGASGRLDRLWLFESCEDAPTELRTFDPYQILDVQSSKSHSQNIRSVFCVFGDGYGSKERL